MKDIILTTRRQRTELITLLVCFVVANGLNLYAILSHNAPLTELVTSFFYIVAFTLVLYGLWTIVRLAFYGVKRLTKRNK